MNIGKKIKMQREIRHMTQQQVADISGKDVTAISKIENGNGSHQIQTIKDIAAAMDCEVKIDIIPKNTGTELLGRLSIIDETDFELDFEEKAKYVHQEIKNSIKSISTKKEYSKWDFFSNIRGPRYKGIILTEVQNTIIDALLKKNIDDLTEKDAVAISINSDYEDLLIDVVMSLSYREVFLDDYGFENGWSISNISSACVLNDHCGYVTFTDFFIEQPEKKGILRSIQKNNSDKIRIAETYLETNSNGFPFICFLIDRDDKSSDNSIKIGYYGDEINTLCGKIVYAWSKDEAIKQYLNTLDDYTMMDYFKNHLVEDIIERIYYDEMYYELLVNGKDIQQTFEDTLKVIDAENKEEFKAYASELLTIDRVFQLLGRENLRKVFAIENEFEVVCFMDDKDKEIYDFVM